MINAWQIYMVMQLDSISAALVVVSIALVIASIVAAFKYDYAKSLREIWADGRNSYGSQEYNKYDASVRSAGRTFKKAIIISATSMMLAALLPSSKTAAAMIVIPAIANNERFQAEAGDIYKLAKQGLQKLVADEQDKKPATE